MTLSTGLAVEQNGADASFPDRSASCGRTWIDWLRLDRLAPMRLLTPHRATPQPVGGADLDESVAKGKLLAKKWIGWRSSD